jgi:hypothetical protein
MHLSLSGQWAHLDTGSFGFWGKFRGYLVRIQALHGSSGNPEEDASASRYIELRRVFRIFYSRKD